MARDGLKPEETPQPRKGIVSDMYDSPPESFTLSEEDKIHWLGSNTIFHRKDSLKSTDNNNNNNNTGSLRSNPHSADFESRACSIIVLPKLRRPFKKDHLRTSSVCLFASPDRSNLIEPRSPKVTCIGRVRSRRGRNGAHHPEQPVNKTRGTRTGWLARLCNQFVSGCKKQKAVDVVTWSEGGRMEPPNPGLAESKKIIA